MGAPMARHIAGAGFSLTVWNRTPDKAATLGASGAAIAPTAADAVSSADVVIVMFSTGQIVDHIFFGDGEADPGIVGAIKRGAIVVVMSSIPVDITLRQSARFKARGIGYVDAPVSGGQGGAEAGKLTIMAGGAPDDIAAITPVMQAMGRITRVGPAGCGQLTKLANQLIVGVTIGAVAEALLLARGGGADVEAVRDALLGGFADSTVLRVHGERMVRQNFEPGAYATYQLKDLAAASASAVSEGLSLPFLELANQLYAEMCQTDLAQADHSALYEYLARFNRLKSD